MTKRMTLMIIFLGIVFGGLFGFDMFRTIMIRRAFAKFAPPPAVVTASKAESAEWNKRIPAVGTLQAVNGVDVSAQVSGIVKAIQFKSGQVVNAGTVLVQIDDDIDKANLANYQAQLSLAQISFTRQQKLVKQNAASQSDLDNARAKLQEAQANVDATLATIDQKTIRAPFDGRVGIRQVNLGQYISPGMKLVSLQAVTPLRLLFSLPEQNLPQLKPGVKVELKTAAYPGKRFAGEVTAIDATSDPQTHNIQVQAKIPNQSEKLYPGLFASLHVLLPEQQQIVTVPETAVAYSLYGNMVYVIKDKGKDKSGKTILRAYREFVTVGDTRNGKVAILKGLKSGDQVVTSGQLKLQNGTHVQINNKNQLPVKGTVTPEQ
jgi:membrane fusion protein, multidrug efflux system